MIKTQRPAGSKGKIIIAEDEGIIGINLRRILSSNGYNVAGVARSGEEVISMVYDDVPDLILMDIMLDGSLSGIQTAEKLNRKFSIPIIYLTALNDDETFLNAYKSSPHAYIVKPFCEEKLLGSIEVVLKAK